MARIRTIKPEFFRHELLQELEKANPGKYCMLVFAGLWIASDREGRFEWKPRTLKLDILPFLDFDMSETMDMLFGEGFIHRYECGGRLYGSVLAWDRHQLVSRDEPPSEIPAPDGALTPYFRPPNQTQRLKIYERDNWTCLYCRRVMREERRAACLDHVVPYSKGGTNREFNLATSCKRCNALKNARTPTEAGMRWPAGLGEALIDGVVTIIGPPVNPPSTTGTTPPDKEGEGEGNGMGTGEGEGTDPPPAGLDTKAWELWSDWCKRRGHPIEPEQVAAAQRHLASFHGEQRAVVDQAIAGGWKNLLPLKRVSVGNGHDAEAERVWDEITRAEQPPTDPRARKAVEAIGGWQRIRLRKTTEVPILRRQFLRAYQEAA